MNILVAAGGTGGHLFPAVAVIEQIQKKFPDTKALFVGSPHKIEARIAPQLGYEFMPIPIDGLRKIFSLATLILPLNILKSALKIKKKFFEFRPDAVLCTGAYISYPAALAASWSGIPLILMESNVYPGKSIKMLANRADKIILSFAESRKFFSERNQQKIEVLGNPVRGKILSPPSKEDARKKFSLKEDVPVILVVGGSLGAVSINRAVEKISSESKFQWLWQTGAKFDIENQLPPNVQAMKFIDDMASAYAAADIVIARAGATTLAELTVSAKPSILVPYPFAANNHQEHNARLMEKAGASKMILDNNIQAELRSALHMLIEDSDALARMSAAAMKLGKADAAKNAAQTIIDLVANNIH